MPESLEVQLAVLAIAQDPASAELSAAQIVIEKAQAAGHRVVGRGVVGDDEDSIRAQLSDWVLRPEIDLVVVASDMDSEHVSTALRTLVTAPLPGFTDLFRWLAFQELGSSAMLSTAEAAQCGTTFVFVLPAGASAVDAAMEKLLLPQLDPKTKPRNLVGSFPRLKTKKPVSDAVPVVIPKEKTASGTGHLPRTPAARSGPNVNVIRADETRADLRPADVFAEGPTKPIDVAKLERQIALAEAESPNDAITKKTDLAKLMARATPSHDDGPVLQPPAARGPMAVAKPAEPKRITPHVTRAGANEQVTRIAPAPAAESRNDAVTRIASIAELPEEAKPTRVEQRTPYAASPIVVPRTPAKPAGQPPGDEDEDIWADVPKPQPPPVSTVPDRDEMAELAAMANEVMGAPIRGSHDDDDDDEKPTVASGRAPMHLPAAERVEKLDKKKPAVIAIPEAPPKKQPAIVVDTPPPVITKPAGLPAQPPGAKAIPSVRATPPAGVPARKPAIEMPAILPKAPPPQAATPAQGTPHAAPPPAAPPNAAPPHAAPPHAAPPPAAPPHAASPHAAQPHAGQPHAATPAPPHAASPHAASPHAAPPHAAQLHVGQPHAAPPAPHAAPPHAPPSKAATPAQGMPHAAPPPHAASHAAPPAPPKRTPPAGLPPLPPGASASAHDEAPTSVHGGPQLTPGTVQIPLATLKAQAAAAASKPEPEPIAATTSGELDLAALAAAAGVEPPVAAKPDRPKFINIPTEEIDVRDIVPASPKVSPAWSPGKKPTEELDVKDIVDAPSAAVPVARPRPPTAPPVTARAPARPAAIADDAPDTSGELPQGAFVYQKPKSGNGKWVALLLVLLVGGGGAAAWKFWPRGEQHPKLAGNEPGSGSGSGSAVVVEPQVTPPPVADPDAAEVAPPIDAAQEIEMDPVTHNPAPPPPHPTHPIGPRPPTPPQPAGSATPPTPPPGPHVSPEHASELEHAAPVPSGEPGCDEVSCVLDKYAQPCCERFKPKAPNVNPGGAADQLDRAAVRSGMEKVKPRVIDCGTQFPAKGTVKLNVTVSPAGRPTNVSVESAPDPQLGECVAAAVRKTSFATAAGETTFTYPFAF
ncbi:MAG TPA: TonB family protein [Kofleriaceae bacterium]